MSLFKIGSSSSGNVRNAVTRYLELKYPKTPHIMYQYMHSATLKNAKNAAEVIKDKLHERIDEDITTNRVNELKRIAHKASLK